MVMSVITTSNESDAYAQVLLGSVYLMMRKYEKAIAAGQRAVALSPNSAFIHHMLGWILSYADKPDEAVYHIEQGIRLNPFPEYYYFTNLGRCYREKGQYEEALIAFKKALHRASGSFSVHLSLAGIYALLDRQEEAEAAAKKVLEINPNYSVERASKTWPYKNPADTKLIIDALRKAGIPE